jgi:protein tyrosine phosphatase
VKGDPYQNAFIATQVPLAFEFATIKLLKGPTKETIIDFWRMVVQEEVGSIIMLCETVEQGAEKCQQVLDCVYLDHHQSI